MIKQRERTCTPLVAYLILSLAAMAPSSSLAQESMPFERINQSVVYLDGRGTGFLVTDSTTLFLVTAAHIAEKVSATQVIKVVDDAGMMMHHELASFTTPGEAILWMYHDSTDVAVTVLAPPDSLLTKFHADALPISFISDTLFAPAPEQYLAVIGFPLAKDLATGPRFSPLRRDTNAASDLLDLKIPDMRWKGTYFILQDPSIQGYSGAPVFAVETHSFGSTIMRGFNAQYFAGLMSATLYDNTGGKLAVVAPAKHIRDTIAKAQHGN